jgi:hypothetical protein
MRICIAAEYLSRFNYFNVTPVYMFSSFCSALPCTHVFGTSLLNPLKHSLRLDNKRLGRGRRLLQSPLLSNTMKRRCRSCTKRLHILNSGDFDLSSCWTPSTQTHIIYINRPDKQKKHVQYSSNNNTRRSVDRQTYFDESVQCRSFSALL